MAAPTYVIRSYGGGAVVAQLQQEMGAVDTSFAIAPVTGWTEPGGAPLGTSGPFTVVVDRFTGSVEKILCASLNVTTGVIQVFTATGFSGRGYDGTTAQAHVPGGSTSGVQTCWSSVEAMEANVAAATLLGTAAGTPTSGQVMTWDGSDPAWATLPGIQTTPLFGVGAPTAGSSPPARLTGAFGIQAGFIGLTFASGFAALTFPQAFANGVMAFSAFPFNSNQNNPVILNHYAVSTTGCEMVVSINAAPYTGLVDFSYMVIGW